MNSRIESLCSVLGDHPRLRIVAALIESESPLSVSDVLDETGVSTHGFYNHIDELIACGAIRKAETEGKRDAYRVEETNEVVAAISKALSGLD